MSPALLPCPFCGKQPDAKEYREHENETGERYGYAAVECHCLGSDGGLFFHFDTAEEAAAAWNRRAPDPRVKQLEEALRPFAEAAEKYSAIWAEQTGGQEEADHDDEPVQFLGWLGSHIDMATLGDFRRAAALLNGGSNERA